MRNKKIYIELTAGRATAAVIDRGRIIHCERLLFAGDQDPNNWLRSLRRFSGELKSFVDRQRLTGASATVVYDSPTASVNLIGVPAASGAGATEAATLSCLDALPYSATAAVMQAEVIGRDRSGDARQVHVLVAAERNDVAGAIVEAIEDAELKYLAASPIDALIMRRQAARALRQADRTMGLLYIGEHSSHFVVGGAGRLDFERRLSFDLHAMESTIRRPVLRDSAGNSGVIELNAEDARRIVHCFGVPDRNAVVHEPIGLTGAQVIPLIQPLLQRLIVELRQSLRFGVSEKRRQEIPIEISGPGASVPGLAQTIGDELGVTIDIDSAWSKYGFEDVVSSGGEFERAIRRAADISRLNLQPNELAGRRRLQRLKKWLWTGAAAALAIIAIDYAQYNARLENARDQANMLSISAGDIEALRATSEKLEETIGALTELDQRVTAETSESVSFRALFNELTRVTPPAVRLTSFNFNRVEDQLVGRVNGYVFDTAGDGGQGALTTFIDSLRASPLLADVRLGDVQIGTVDGAQGRRFDAELIAVAVPQRLIDAHLASADGPAGAGDRKIDP